MFSRLESRQFNVRKKSVWDSSSEDTTHLIVLRIRLISFGSRPTLPDFWASSVAGLLILSYEEFALLIWFPYIWYDASRCARITPRGLCDEEVDNSRAAQRSFTWKTLLTREQHIHLDLFLVERSAMNRSSTQKKDRRSLLIFQFFQCSIKVLYEMELIHISFTVQLNHPRLNWYTFTELWCL